MDEGLLQCDSWWLVTGLLLLPDLDYNMFFWKKGVCEAGTWTLPADWCPRIGKRGLDRWSGLFQRSCRQMSNSTQTIKRWKSQMQPSSWSTYTANPIMVFCLETPMFSGVVTFPQTAAGSPNHFWLPVTRGSTRRAYVFWGIFTAGPCHDTFYQKEDLTTSVAQFYGISLIYVLHEQISHLIVCTRDRTKT